MKVNFNTYFKDFDGGELLIMINPKALEGLLHNVCLTEPVSIQPVICKWTMKKNYSPIIFV